MLCRALFHVMSRTEEIGHVLVRAIPTHSKRDGTPAEENRRFWEATPSGELLIRLAAGSPLLGSPAMQLGAYVFLDLDEPGAEGSWIATEWKVETLTIHGSYRQFRAEVVPVDERRDNPGVNTAAGITGWGSKLTMDVNNLAVLPTFAFEPGVPRLLSIRFSLSEPHPS